MEQDGFPPQSNNEQPGGFQPQQPSMPPQQGGFPQPPPNYGQPFVQYPEESQAVLSLVLSIVGLVACTGLLCPVGLYFGKKEMDAIDAGRRDPSKRDMAKAGWIIGIIGTVLLVLGVLFFIGILILAFAGAAGTA